MANIKINIGNRTFGIALLLLFTILTTLAVYAFQSGQTPSRFGHSSDEIRFNVTYTTNAHQETPICGMSSFQTIANTSGNSYCAITAWDDDSSRPLTTYECLIQRRSDGSWEYRFANGCGDTICGFHCIQIK